jgi:hypothetical protein
MSQPISERLEYLRKRAKGLLESVVHRKGACCVRWGGVGALE